MLHEIFCVFLLGKEKSVWCHGGGGGNSVFARASSERRRDSIKNGAKNGPWI